MVAPGVIGLELEEEEEAVEVVVRALEPGHSCMPIDLNTGKDEEMVHSMVARVSEPGPAAPSASRVIMARIYYYCVRLTSNPCSTCTQSRTKPKLHRYLVLMKKC